MAVAWGDLHTLECLDTAAEAASIRGAPAAAAELLDMAVGLGVTPPSGGFGWRATTLPQAMRSVPAPYSRKPLRH
jgi:hypothetical protein